MSNSRSNNISLPPTLQRLKQGAIETRPEQIEDLWRRQLPVNHPLTQFEHIHAQHMDWWVTEQEVSELLNDEDRLLAIRQDLNVRALQIGMVGQTEYATLAANNCILYNPTCSGCNNPYDNPGACTHPGSPRAVANMNPEVNQVAHETLVILAVVNYLLAQEHVLTRTNKLALLLAPARKGPPGIEEMQNGSFPSICFILGLMDNCSQAFPKIAHHAAGLLSLLICTNPAAAFSCLDGKGFVDSIFKYMSDIFRLVHNAECRVEEQFGVVAFLNILPSLYHFGNWNEAKSSHQFNDFLAFFTSVVINICHGATLGHEVDRSSIDDGPNNLDQLPELMSAKVFMESLLLVKEEADANDKPMDWRIQFLHEQPKTFSVMASLEVLGWWIINDINLKLARVDCGDDPDETIKSCIEEYASDKRALLVTIASTIFSNLHVLKYDLRRLWFA